MSSLSPYIISPYVREVPPEVVDCYLSTFPCPPDAVLINGDHVIVDEISQRAIIVSKKMWQQFGFDQDRAGEVRSVLKVSPALFLLEEMGLVVSRKMVGCRHCYSSLEIEVNTHCNFRCEFCPVQTAPKPRHVMQLRLYERVLERARDYGIKQISLNHYSEPTLDPFLVKRVELAAEYRLSVELYTNGSGLTPYLLDAIVAAARDISIIVNLPSADAQQHARVTDAKCFNRVISNLQYAFSHQVPVTIVVNAPLGQRMALLKRVQTIVGEENTDEVILWDTDDRAGRLVSPNYSSTRFHGDRLGGCILALQDLNVGYDGKVFLCAQDYNKEYVLGDLVKQSIEEIAEGNRAISLREVIFGIRPAPSDLICLRCAWTVSHDQKTHLFSIGNEHKLRWGVKQLSNLLAKWPVKRLGTPSETHYESTDKEIDTKGSSYNEKHHFRP